MREFNTTIFPPMSTTVADHHTADDREPHTSTAFTWLRRLWPTPRVWRAAWTVLRSTIGFVLACVVFVLSIKYYGTIAAAIGISTGIEGPPDLFSSFAAGLVRFSVAAIGFVTLHTFMLRRIKSDEAIANKNVAYGLFLIALAIVIHAAVAGS